MSRIFYIAVNREGTFINLGKPRPTRHTYFVMNSAAGGGIDPLRGRNSSTSEIYVYYIGRETPSVQEQLEIQAAIVSWIDGKDIKQ